MQLYARASLLLAVVFLSASCSDTDARLSPTQPSDVSTAALVVEATSASAVAEPVRNPVCPVVAPFNVPGGVIVSSHAPTDVTVRRIRVRFTDTMGRQAPQITLPMPPVTLPAPSAQIGIATPFTRTFPFIFGIGCHTGARGTAVVIVEGTDDGGRPISEQVTITVH